MSTYVLIHGAWHGMWCWDKVISLLRQAGHQVITFDLPGHGQDKTPLSEVTLDLYIQRARQVLAAQSQPVILLGHSMGGIVVSEMAERFPIQIRKMIYLTAFLLRDGEYLLQYAQNDAGSLATANLTPDEKGISLSLPKEKLRDIFYADCSEEDTERAGNLIRPQAIQPLKAPIHVTAENFGRIPRIYIECLQDRTISIACQRQMYATLPCQKVYTLDAGHSPFFSMPEGLAKLQLWA
ncbi:alpha/beta fold hydrolase [Ktedonosporobacter rubrisoli]|uniref:Alpha/beta fold hydrolase n=1 Tax=Ktedonosporobacter rubrisoli TaxID=2509675 RepID=A0A4P6JVS9_KTERU|nr:alpha/beta fold hydrolase [Ktedonosporobacter rubrisoli]QBD79644.1 alpha/beta fold hydrolase [Ktedonosporobacter rubrisoli]